MYGRHVRVSFPWGTRWSISGKSAGPSL